jgi:hypothetical protein
MILRRGKSLPAMENDTQSHIELQTRDHENIKHFEVWHWEEWNLLLSLFYLCCLVSYPKPGNYIN